MGRHCIDQVVANMFQRGRGAPENLYLFELININDTKSWVLIATSTCFLWSNVKWSEMVLLAHEPIGYDARFLPEKKTLGIIN